jgi:hypothetical protein
MSDLVGAIWELIFRHRTLRRVMFIVLVGVTLYVWGPLWSLLALWVFVFGITELLEAIGWK